MCQDTLEVLWGLPCPCRPQTGITWPCLGTPFRPHRQVYCPPSRVVMKDTCQINSLDLTWMHATCIIAAGAVAPGCSSGRLFCTAAKHFSVAGGSKLIRLDVQFNDPAAHAGGRAPHSPQSSGLPPPPGGPAGFPGMPGPPFPGEHGDHHWCSHLISSLCAHSPPCHCMHILCISCGRQAPQPLLCMPAVHRGSALKGRLHMRSPAVHSHLTCVAHIDTICWWLQRFCNDKSHALLAAGPGMQHMRGHPGHSAWQRPPPHHMMGPRPPPMIPLVGPLSAWPRGFQSVCTYTPLSLRRC